MSSSKKKNADAAKAPGKSKSARTGPPYVGRRVHIYQSTGGHALPEFGVIVGHVGDLLGVRDDAGKEYWADTRVIPGFDIVDDPAAAPDSVTASDFPALKSRYGSVDVKVGEGKRPAAG